MRWRTLLVTTLLILASVVVQTTLFGRLQLASPDLVLLVGMVLALSRIRPEAVLAAGFVAGLLVDLVGASLLGLRAVVYTTVVFVALRTRERAELGRVTVALWVGGLTFLGVVLVILVATLFGQAALLGDDALGRMVATPLANLILAALLAPTLVRIIDRDPTALRYP